MAFQIVWSQSALADLRAIVRYIARDDSGTAERFGRMMISKVESIAEFPRTGRIVPEFRQDDLREIIVPPYRIVYGIDDSLNKLTILRVWHGARGDIELHP